MSKIAFVLNDADNVATVIGGDVPSGESVALRGAGETIVTAVAAIPDGHKFALRDIPAGGHVVKYGSVIGRTTAAVGKGDHVHIHNMESLRGRGDLMRAEIGGRLG